jgi:hypothetical protein
MNAPAYHLGSHEQTCWGSVWEMTLPPTSHFPAGYKSIKLISLPNPTNNMNFSFPYDSFKIASISVVLLWIWILFSKWPSPENIFYFTNSHEYTTFT